jgi:similar to spore coat protein
MKEGMNLISLIQNLIGMGNITEQVIATDFLLAAKAGVKNYSVAISEATSPEVREVLRRHLHTAIDTHENILGFMLRKGYYHAYDPAEQLNLDMQVSDTVLGIQQ